MTKNRKRYCDKCGEKMPEIVETKGTIYLDPGKYDWFNDEGEVSVNVHIWYTDGSNNSWPGAKMKLNEDGLYEAENYTSKTVKAVIFTRNSTNPNPLEGTKTEYNRLEIGEINFNNATPVFKLSYYYQQGDVENFKGKWLAVGEEDYDDVSDGDKPIYVDFRNIPWFMTSDPEIRIYIWYTDGSNNRTYPGREATLIYNDEGKAYAATVNYDSTKYIAGIIICRCNPALDENHPEAIWNKIELSGEIDNLDFEPLWPAYKLTSMEGDFFTGTWESEEDLYKYESQPGPGHDEEETVDSTVTKYFYLNAIRLDWFDNNDPDVRAKAYYSDHTVSGEKGIKGTKEDGIYKFGYNGTKDVTKIVVYRLAPDTGLIWNSFEITLSTNPNKNVYVLYSLSDTTGSTGVWTQMGGAVTSAVTIYYYNSNNWSNVTLYTWKSETEYAAAWPGEAMTAVEGHEGWYSKEIDSSNIFVIFSNNGEDQTADIQMDFDNPYYYNNGWHNTYPEDTLTGETVTIYYYNSDSWSSVYFYAWKDDYNHNAGWPGVAMNKVTGHDGWYQAEMDTYYKYVIFSGDGEQTSNIAIEDDKYYYREGWTNDFATANVWDGTLTVNITYEYFGDAEAYLYVWYTDGTDNTWPGEKMTRVEGNVFTYQVDATKKISGVVVVRGNGEGEYWNKSNDITIIPSNHVIVVDNMIAYS